MNFKCNKEVYRASISNLSEKDQTQDQHQVQNQNKVVHQTSIAFFIQNITIWQYVHTFFCIISQELHLLLNSLLALLLNLESNKEYYDTFCKRLWSGISYKHRGFINFFKCNFKNYLVPLFVSSTERGEKIGLDQEKRSLFNPLILHKISLLIL